MGRHRRAERTTICSLAGPQLRASEELFARFHDRPATEGEHYCISLEWPAPQGVFGYVRKIGYRSDKWGGTMRDYIHDHRENNADGPLPVLLRQRRASDPLWKKPFLAAGEVQPLALLGHCLDIEFDMEDGHEPEHLDFKQYGDRDLPLLAADSSRNLLVVAPQWGGPCYLLWSPVLRVTERGIER